MKSKWITTAGFFALVVGLAVTEARAAPPMDTGQGLVFEAAIVDNNTDLVYEVPIVGPQRPGIAAIGANNVNQTHRKDGISVPWPQEACDNGNVLSALICATGNREAASETWREGGGLASATLMKSGTADEFVPIIAKSITIG
jgi:hypothetical protein